MITDPVLINRVHSVVASKPRKAVTSADVLAVIQKESGGVSHFTGTEPLFKANLRAAQQITGLSEIQILQVVTFPDGPLQGKFYKFRCEPGYWEWASKLRNSWTPQERFLLSCSFGLGQKMARWLVGGGIEPLQWIPFIHKFARDQNLQIQYCAGDLDALLWQARNDKDQRFLAFTRYNQGTRDKNKDGKPDLIVSDYGRIVEGYRKDFVRRGI